MRMGVILFLLTVMPTFCQQDNSTKELKIAIVSLYDRSYKEIGQYSDYNKIVYAQKHKYDIFLYHNKLDDSRHVAWSKIPAIENHLDHYDWIWWTDADSLVMNKDIKLESFIKENFDLIITQEATAKNYNTGSFLIKNSDWSKQLLKDIYEQTEYSHMPPWEQQALAKLLKKNHKLFEHILVLPQRTMNSHISEPGGTYKKGDFIIHFYGPIAKACLMKTWYYKSLQK